MKVKILTVMLVGLTLLVGLIDVFLRGVYAQSIGLRHAVHDPALGVFHLIVLPILVFIMVQKFPAPLIDEVKKKGKKCGSALFALFILTAAVGSIYDAQTRFNEGLMPAEDYADDSLRGELKLERGKQQTELTGTAAEKLLQLKAWRGLYKNKVEITHSKASSLSIEPWMNYFQRSSWRSKWATFLTFIGLSVFGVILLLPIYHLLLQSKMFDETYDLMLLAGILLSTWVPFRLYSEWFNNFGEVPDASYSITFLLIAIGAFGIAATVILRTTPTIVKIIVALAPIASTAFSIIAKFRSEWLNPFALLIADTKTPFLVVFYGIAALFMILFVRYLMSPGNTNAPLPAVPDGEG